MAMWKQWRIMVGPNPGRNSTHAHGPQTRPIQVIEAKDVAMMFSEVAAVLDRRDPLECKMMAEALRIHQRDIQR